MLVRYQADEHGCCGEYNEVVFIPDEITKEKDLDKFLQEFIYSFGCSQCVEYSIIEDMDTKPTMTIAFDEIFNRYYLVDVIQDFVEDVK